MVKCKTCEENAVEYNHQYDSFYCGQCDVWLEGACDVASCSFCFHRPLKPSMMDSRYS